MKEVMIDIETLSTKNNAVILTIGAIKFDRKDDIIELKDMEKFYYRIEIDSCKKLGMDIDEDTLKWWESQEEDAKFEALLNEDRKPIKIVLTKLSIFLRGVQYFWANSPNFDFIILENAYKICNLLVPWKFWSLRDCRTVYDLANTKLSSIGETKHNSLDDCYNQILCLRKSLKKLKLVK